MNSSENSWIRNQKVGQKVTNGLVGKPGLINGLKYKTPLPTIKSLKKRRINTDTSAQLPFFIAMQTTPTLMTKVILFPQLTNLHWDFLIAKPTGFSSKLYALLYAVDTMNYDHNT